MARWQKVALWVVAAVVLVVFVIPGMLMAVLQNNAEFRAYQDEAETAAAEQAAEIMPATAPAAAQEPRPTVAPPKLEYLGPLDPLQPPPAELLQVIRSADPAATPAQVDGTARKIVELAQEAKASRRFKWHFARDVRYEVAPAPMDLGFEVIASRP